jgi:hypothetical protein
MAIMLHDFLISFIFLTNFFMVIKSLIGVTLLICLIPPLDISNKKGLNMRPFFLFMNEPMIYIIPPIPPMPPMPPISGIAGAGSSFGSSATIHSVVSIKPATEAAF